MISSDFLGRSRFREHNPLRKCLYFKDNMLQYSNPSQGAYILLKLLMNCNFLLYNYYTLNWFMGQPY